MHKAGRPSPPDPQPAQGPGHLPSPRQARGALASHPLGALALPLAKPARQERAACEAFVPGSHEGSNRGVHRNYPDHRATT